MFDVLDPEYSRALFAVGATLLFQVARGTYMSNAAEPKDLMRAMIGGPLAGFGAAAANLAGPAGGALAAVAAAAAAGISAPWASNGYLLLALTLAPGLLASLLAFKLLHVALKALKGPVIERRKEPAVGAQSAEEPGKKSKEKEKEKEKKKEAADVKESAAEEEPADRTAAAYISADESADWNILAGNGGAVHVEIQYSHSFKAPGFNPSLHLKRDFRGLQFRFRIQLVPLRNVAYIMFIAAFMVKKSLAGSYAFLVVGQVIQVECIRSIALENTWFVDSILEPIK
jgi:hypothetical protein